MEDDPLSRAMTITDARQAAVFASSSRRRLLLCFAGDPQSLSEAAAATGLDLKRLHHHATRLRELGLLRIVGERRRAGRPIKLYQAVASAFYVPDELAPAPFGERLARELRESLAEERARSSALGMLFTLGPGGEPTARTIGETGGSGAPGEMWRILRLSQADARSLTAELGEVLARYESRAAQEGDLWIAHAAVVRRRPETAS
jgi:hypothetical protein